MAGTGYWCALLATMGIDTLASDLEPETNRYHKGARLWHPVQAVNGIEAATHPEAVQRTLLLSWPPYGEPVGANILNAYLGPRVIYIGEPCGGCCGDDDLFEAFDRDWELVAEHTPIQWAGIHDLIQVYDRKEA